MIEILRFDGFLNNYEELCRQAGVSAGRQCEESLKVLTAACYRTWGKDMFVHMDGGFFLALYDGSAEEYVIGRDRFGIRSGYYVCRKGMPFRFGTTAAEVLRAARLRPEVDVKSLQLYLTFSFVPGPGTMFDGVSKLLPGEFGVYKKGQITLRRYWTPSYQPETGVPLEEWAERTDRALRAAAAKIPRDRETHALLSSGVDSAYLAAVSGAAVTHTACFRDSTYHEETGAAKTAEALGIRNVLHLIDPDRYLRSIPDVVRCLEEPTGDASEPALYLMCMELKESCGAVLSAEGIDELFGGYHVYRAALRRAPYWLLPGPVRRAAARIAGRFPNLPGRWLMLAGERDIEEFPGNTLVFETGAVRALMQPGTASADPGGTVRHCCPGGGDRDMITIMCDHDLRLGFCWNILQNIDKISHAAGVRFYMPFVSKGAFDAAAAVPSGYKVTKSSGKLVFRRAAMRALPEEICSRRKIGFETPVCRWMQQEAFILKIKEAYAGPAAQQFFRPQKLERLLDGFAKHPGKYWRQIWTIYMFLEWHAVWIAGARRNGRLDGRPDGKPGETTDSIGERNRADGS